MIAGQIQLNSSCRPKDFGVACDELKLMRKLLPSNSTDRNFISAQTNLEMVTPTLALAVVPAVDVELYTLNSVKYQLKVSTDMVQWTAQGGVVVGNGGSQNHLVRASKATQFWRLKVVQ